MLESALLKLLHVRLSALGARLFRNNVAFGWVGDAQKISSPTTLTLYPGDVVIRGGRPLHAGLCVGSSDFIGWKTVVITADMVGRPIAQFCAVEAKRPGNRVTPEQANFLSVVAAAGGRAFAAYDDDEAVNLFKSWESNGRA